MQTLNELFKVISADAEAVEILRRFNIAPSMQGKAISVKELAESLGFDVVLGRLPNRVAGTLTRDAFSRNGFQ